MGNKNVTQYFNFLFRKLGIMGVAQIEGLTSQLMNTVEALVLILNEDGRIIEFNPACERLSGYKKYEVLGKRYESLMAAEGAERAVQIAGTMLSANRTWQEETHWLTKEGKKRLITWSNTSFAEKNGFPRYLIATGLDVTEVRLREKRQALKLEIFTAIGSTGDQDEILERILYLFQEYCHCDAVGIRLRDGKDYPYLRTSGFSATFVRDETALCSPKQIRPDSDEKESAILECLCGRVICGNLDSSLVSITEQGAFFTDNINELAALLAKKKLPFTVRNYCGQAGFSSVALIPLRFSGETVGLLQLNDRAQGKFNNDEVDFLASTAQSIGATLFRFQAEKACYKSQLILDVLAEKAKEGFFLTSHDGEVSLYSKAMEQISGYTRDQVVGHGLFRLLFPLERERRQAVQKARLVMAGKLDGMELGITCIDGQKTRVRFSLAPLEIEGKQYTLTTMSKVVKSELIKTVSSPIPQ